MSSHNIVSRSYEQRDVKYVTIFSNVPIFADDRQQLILTYVDKRRQHLATSTMTRLDQKRKGKPSQNALQNPRCYRRTRLALTRRRRRVRSFPGRGGRPPRLRRGSRSVGSARATAAFGQ